MNSTDQNAADEFHFLYDGSGQHERKATAACYFVGDKPLRGRGMHAESRVADTTGKP